MTLKKMATRKRTIPVGSDLAINFENSQRGPMRSSFNLWFWLLVAPSLAVNGSPLLAAETGADGQFAALLHDEWEFRLREDPLFASETGDHRFDDKLPKV